MSRSFFVGFYEDRFAEFFDPELYFIVYHMTVFADQIVKKEVLIEIERALYLAS